MHLEECGLGGNGNINWSMEQRVDLADVAVDRHLRSRKYYPLADPTAAVSLRDSRFPLELAAFPNSVQNRCP